VEAVFGLALAGPPLDGGKNGGQVLLVVNRSELDYGKARDSLEIPEVERRYLVGPDAPLSRRYRQILRETLGSAFHKPDKIATRNRACQRIDNPCIFF
jgi:hypothetical protein